MPTPHSPNDDRLRELERLFNRMRAAAAAQRPEERRAEGGICVFPTAVTNGRAWAAEVSQEPGVFPAGETWVDYRVRVGSEHGTRTNWMVEVEGRFCVVVADDANVAVPDAQWRVRTFDGEPLDVDDLAWRDQLPRSVLAPRLAGPRLARATGRLIYDGEEARAELLRTQRGLVNKIVSQYRRQLAAEANAIDVDDLEQVGLERLLDLARRRFAATAAERPTTAAWSKVAMREIGNAIKSEIASVTGVSVEFRQLLTWFRLSPADRDREPADVAKDMAMAAATTRLVQAHLANSPDAATALLNAMLRDGRAIYLAPGTTAAQKASARAEGIFVVSPRSSIAEIERAQRYDDRPGVALDAPMAGDANATAAEWWLADEHDDYEAVDVRLYLDSALTERGLSDVERAVWCARTGALGTPDELPEIASDLGLDGRSEARAALRRAWRKLDSLGDELRASMT